MLEPSRHGCPPKRPPAGERLANLASRVPFSGRASETTHALAPTRASPAYLWEDHGRCLRLVTDSGLTPNASRKYLLKRPAFVNPQLSATSSIGLSELFIRSL